MHLGQAISLRAAFKENFETFHCFRGWQTVPFITAIPYFPASLVHSKIFFLLLLLHVQAFAADPPWQTRAGAYASFQAPSDMARDTVTPKADGNIEIFDGTAFSLTFQCATGALPRELQTDLEKAIAYWSKERLKNWRVNTYLEDDQKLAYAAIRTVADPSFRDPRPYHLSFGFAAGDKPFSIHFRFSRPEDLVAIEKLLQSIKLKTL